MSTGPLRLAFAATVGAAAFLAARASDANAPACQYTIAAGTVYDTKSKLTWQQTVPATTYSWASAKSYCSGLSLAGTGWRLPTLKELFSIVDLSQTAAPYIDPVAFPGTASAFWSSTLMANSPSSAWIVSFDDPETDGSALSSTYYVRCVR